MKKILVLALAGLPLVASAESVIYGKLKMGLENDRISGLYGYTQVGVDASNRPILVPSRYGSKSVTRIEDYGTRIGFAGGENIGAGLRAIWQIELGLGPDSAGKSDADHDAAYTRASGTPRVALRDSYVGLEGSFGKVRLGRLSNVLMDNANASGKFGMIDNWEGNFANTLATYSRFDKRINNSVRYDSPNWAGFSFAAQYGLDEAEIRDINMVNGVAVDDITSTKRNHVMGLGLAYNHGSGIFAGIAHERSRAYGGEYYTGSLIGNTLAYHTPTGQRTRVEAGYDANNILVALGYQMGKGNTDYDGNTMSLRDRGLLKSREAAVTLGYRFGQFMPKVSFAKGWDAKFSDVVSIDPNMKNTYLGSGYTQFIVGADYDLTKRTRLGFAYGQQKMKSVDRAMNGLYNGTENVAAYNYESAGAKQRTFGLNLVHAF